MSSPVHHAKTRPTSSGEGVSLTDYSKDLLQSWPTDKLLAANLAALQQCDPDLAAEIASAMVPSSYTLATAKDQSVTYRYLDRMGHSHWLGDCSVPKVFAETNIERIGLGNENLALNGAGAGMDMKLMLGRMSPYQALFVLEPRAFNIKLVCQLHDFSRWLVSGRLVFLCRPEPEKALEKFLLAHRGYNIVQKAVALPTQSESENQAFSRRLQEAMENVLIPVMRDVQRLQVSQEATDQQVSKEDSWQAIMSCRGLRATNATNTWSESDVLTSRDAMAGLAALEAEIEWFVYDRPDRVSTEAQLQRIADLHPHLIVLVDTFRENVHPSLPSSSICATLIREATEPEALSDHDFVFVPRRQQIECFTDAGAPADRLFELPLAANTDIYQPLSLSDEQRLRIESDVALVANRPSVDPKEYNINLPTHQKLWQSVINEIQLMPEKYQFDSAKRVLKRAQSCGVELKEDDIIDHFTQLIQRYLGETVQREHYALEVVQNNFDLKIWGYRGLEGQDTDGSPEDWQASELRDLAAGCVFNGSRLNQIYNAAKIHLYFSSRGWMDQFVLDGIAAGAFFLVKSHPNDRRPGGLGQYFEPGKEVITFDSPRDLLQKIKYYLTHGPEREAIARAAREKCLTQHSMQIRMKDMLQMIARKQKV